MGLADSIIRENKRPKKRRDVDEYRMGIVDNPQYIAARAIRINYLKRRKDPNYPLLHTRRRATEIWLGDELLPCNRQSIYRLCELDRGVKEHEVWAIFEALKENLPLLREDKIMVSDHVYWDIEKGELVKISSKDKMLYI